MTRGGIAQMIRVGLYPSCNVKTRRTKNCECC